MIREKDVVTLRMPFPNISSELAQRSHMYICKENYGTIKKLIKIQTFKTELILSQIIKNYGIIERKNYPFLKKAKNIIDCDKVFLINNVTIPTNLIADDGRAKIESNDFNIINNKLESNPNIDYIQVEKNDFLRCNHACY